MFRTYFEALSGFRRLAVACVALLFVSGLAEALGIAALFPLLSSNLSAKAGGRSEWFGLSGDALIWASIGALVGLGVLAAALRYLGESWSLRLSVSLERSLRTTMTSTLLRMRWTDYLRITLGDGLKAAVYDGGQIGSGAHALVQALGNAGVAVVFVALAFVVDPVMTAAVLVFGGVMAVVYRRVGQRSQALSTDLSVNAAVITESATDLLSNAKFYRSTGLHGRVLAQIDAHFGEWARIFRRLQRFVPLTRFGGDTAGIAFIAGVLVVTVIVLNRSLAGALVFLALFYRLAPRLQLAQQSVLVARTQESWWHTWKARYDKCVLAAEEPSGTRELAEPPTIEFDAVSLTYPDRSTPAIVEVSCTIEPGQCLAVVGESGAGKTTMLDLVTGLIRPSSGSIRLDGIDFSEVERDAWRQRIGLVMQESPVYHGTVLENIAFTEVEPDEQRAWWAADMANLSDVVRSLPDGLQTQVGQKGAALSGGQRQRLALARALYRRPWLLVLDEATSALDSESERLIQEALASLRTECSMLVVAHRLKTVQIADHILVLSRGRVVEEGSWDELSSRNGLFCKMLAAQQANAPTDLEPLRAP